MTSYFVSILPHQHPPLQLLPSLFPPAITVYISDPGSNRRPQRRLVPWWLWAAAGIGIAIVIACAATVVYVNLGVEEEAEDLRALVEGAGGGEEPSPKPAVVDKGGLKFHKLLSLPVKRNSSVTG